MSEGQIRFAEEQDLPPSSLLRSPHVRSRKSLYCSMSSVPFVRPAIAPIPFSAGSLLRAADRSTAIIIDIS
ncbi:hypothetical protein GWI33_018919 [Rhynchophorus ferrugineus]|uniref:Uncharacterized protein n=1 Tax=Rhynchophorus ferrugineus TaxID=354439 RepID=A0A834M5T1_RHYFE|nr:hypothetical protein GWI33_018919 [Rhynchophorus ferrugineus]